MITLPASCACFFMLFFVCFPLFRSYIARYVTEKKRKTGIFEHKKQRNDNFLYNIYFRNLNSFL